MAGCVCDICMLYLGCVWSVLLSCFFVFVLGLCGVCDVFVLYKCCVCTFFLLYKLCLCVFLCWPCGGDLQPKGDPALCWMAVTVGHNLGEGQIENTAKGEKNSQVFLVWWTLGMFSSPLLICLSHEPITPFNVHNKNSFKGHERRRLYHEENEVRKPAEDEGTHNDP